MSSPRKNISNSNLSKSASTNSIVSFNLANEYIPASGPKVPERLATPPCSIYQAITEHNEDKEYSSSDSETPLSGRGTPFSGSRFSIATTDDLSGTPTPEFGESSEEFIEEKTPSSTSITSHLTKSFNEIPKSTSISFSSPKPVTPHSGFSSSSSQISSSLSNSVRTSPVPIRKGDTQANINAINSILKGFTANPKLNAQDAANAIYSIGLSTQQSLSDRPFHHSIIKRNLELINLINQHYLAKTMSATDIIKAISGIAKLQLNSNVLSYKITLETLYGNVSTNLTSQYKNNIRAMVDCITAALRLDNGTKIFTKILPSIIDHAYKLRHKASSKQLFALINAVANLDSNNNATLTNDQIKDLLKMSFKALNLSGHALSSSGNVSADNSDYHEVYLALTHFIQRNPTVFHYQEELKQLKFKLTLVEGKPSQTQNEIAKKIKKSVHKITNEKSFDEIPFMPVDAHVQLDKDTDFILQVDGPSHFLHDENQKTIPSKKSVFRDNLIRNATQKPLVTIPYFEWNQAKAKDETFKYLDEKIFAATQKHLPKAKSNQASAQGFFENCTATPTGTPTHKPQSATSRGKPTIQHSRSMNSFSSLYEPSSDESSLDKGCTK